MTGICQDCHDRPATYGDGLTFERCSECQYKYETLHGEEQPGIPPAPKGVGEEHKIIPGLISIIMPVHMANYSLFHMTGNCIGSIREHTNKEKTPYELIIVDNGSAIKPPKMESYYADKVITWEENRGVTKAWNAAIRVSFGEYIVLINNDTLVYDGWLENLKSELDNGLDLVMSHPMYSLTEPFARAVEANAARDGIKKFDQAPRDFSCVMFKKDLFEKLGDDYMFDERLVSYCSDVDLYERMDAKGLKYAVSTKSFHHHIADATGYAIGVNEVMDKDKETMEQIRKERNRVEDINKVLQEIPTPGGFIPVNDVNNLSPNKFIRCNKTGDKIFLLRDGKTHPIADPDTYHALGGDFGQEVIIEVSEFDTYSMGEPINSFNVEKYA